MLTLLPGHRPEVPGVLQALWDQLWTGESQSTSEGEPELLRCHRALLDPASLKEWPEEMLEGEGFSAYLARLLAWTSLQKWMDTAPASQELEFRRQLERSAFHCGWLEARQHRFLPLQAWFFREKARLVGFQGGDPLPWLERSLQLAGALGQFAEVARCRAFLADSSAAPGGSLDAEQRLQLQPLLAGVPAMVEATRLEDLRRLLLTTVLELVPMEAALWLEKSDQWEVLDWWPREAHPRYSASLVEECWRSQELRWGQPEQLRASRSILLSEVRGLLAVPVGERGVLFAWHSAQQPWLSGGQVETLQFLAGLATTLMSNLALTELARTDLAQSKQLHRRWNTIFHEVEKIALAELSDQAELLSWNARFGQLFPHSKVGTPAWEQVPEAERLRDRERLSRLAEADSCLLRIDGDEGPRWYQITDWKVAGEIGSYRAVIDVSEQETEQWFDYLEEVRHRLACDLHDGPAQVAAAMKMSSPTLEVSSTFENLRLQLDCLRSPWREDREPWAWLEQILDRNFPNCLHTLEVTEMDSSRQQCLFRTILAVMRALGDAAVDFACQGTAAGASLTWVPESDLSLPETTRRLLDSKLTILSGSWSLRPGSLELSFGG